jgi:hypothetical protein
LGKEHRDPEQERSALSLMTERTQVSCMSSHVANSNISLLTSANESQPNTL